MLHYRFATNEDVDLIYHWSNDPIVRQFSYNSEPIVYENHVQWFQSKLHEASTFFYIFQNEQNENIGLVRIEKKQTETIIGILIDKDHRGKSYASEMLTQAAGDFLKKFQNESISAYIKNDNLASIKSFTKAGFSKPINITINGIPSVMLTKK